MTQNSLQRAIERNVRDALQEDIGTGDVTAALIAESSQARAVIISRTKGVFCGRPWADETVRQLGGGISIDWQVKDGDTIQPTTEIAHLSGSSRILLSAERTILNFIQLLSATATRAKQYSESVKGTNAQVLDTRKTIPGLRDAQKYAVQKGGVKNHRMGLHDAYLIKENHIAAAGSISQAVEMARRQNPQLLLEVEVEDLSELQECVDMGVSRVLIDNFSINQMRDAVEKFGRRIELEASGGVTLDSIKQIAETGVEFISIGEITKNVNALDLSMQFM